MMEKEVKKDFLKSMIIRIHNGIKVGIGIAFKGFNE